MHPLVAQVLSGSDPAQVVEVTAATMRKREKRKVQRVKQWADHYDGQSFSVPSSRGILMIHPSTKGGWRGTQFTVDMKPLGHAEFRTYGQAVFWGSRVSMDLEKAVLATNPTAPRATKGITFQ